MVMAFNPDDPHDGHAAGDGGFTYRMVHIWPEFFASLTGRPLPLFRTPVIQDPAVAASVRRLHDALAGSGSGLERDERVAGTARLLVRPAAGANLHAAPARREATRGGADRRVAARIRELIRASAGDLGGQDLGGRDLGGRDLGGRDLGGRDLGAR